MALPCEVLADLTKVGGHTYETGIRNYTDWSKKMKETVPFDLSEGALQRVWSQMKAELANHNPAIASRMKSPVFADQLAQRLGRSGSADFIAHLDDLHPDIYERMLTGGKLTEPEQKIVSDIYRQYAPKKGKTSAVVSAPSSPIEELAQALKATNKEHQRAMRELTRPARQSASAAKQQAKNEALARAGVNKSLEDMTNLFPEKPPLAPLQGPATFVKTYRDAAGDLTKFARKVRAEYGAEISDDKMRELFTSAANQFKQDYKNVFAIKRELADQINRTRVSTTQEQTTSLLKAVYLTPARLLTRNIISHSARMIAMEAARTPASWADMLISKATGADRSLPLHFRPAFRGDAPVLPGYPGNNNTRLQEIWRHVTELAKKGSVEDDPFGESTLAAFGLSRETVFKNPLIGLFANAVFRSHSITDRPFRMLAMYRAIDDIALSQAMSEAKAGTIKQSEVATRAEALRNHPTPEMLTEAVYQGQAAVFQGSNKLSTAISNLKSINKDDPLARAVIDTHALFTRVPVNVVMDSINLTPLGGLKAAYAQRLAMKAAVNKALTPQQTRQISMLYGLGFVGTATTITGYLLAQSGLLTGFDFGSGDYQKREVKKGETSASFHFGDKYYALKTLEPAAFSLLFGASLYEQLKDKKPNQAKLVSPQNALDTGAIFAETAAKSGWEAFKGLPLISSIVQTSEDMEKPEKKGSSPFDTIAMKAAKVVAPIAVPGLISDVSKQFDDKRRTPQTPADVFKQRIPGLRRQVPVNTKDTRPLEEGPLYNPFAPTAQGPGVARKSRGGSGTVVEKAMNRATRIPSMRMK